ncbi:rRNA N-glycosidase [Hordeum vulgare]|nr:rRNA N-glycosidase [Hordeum vulgare]
MRFHSENPHEYRGLRVQIIFRDYDGYMLGFRVRRNGRLTKWYYCSNKEFPIPFFIQEDATKLPFREDYVMKPLIGGAATFMNIFKQFSQYPEVKDRIRRNEAPSDLDCKVPGMELPTGLAWASLGNWSMDCKQVLNSAFKGEYRPRTGAKFAETVAPVKTFGQLISQDEESGHLSLLMRVEKIVAPEGGWVLTRLKKKANNPGLEVVDPGFPDDPVLPEDE